jgi:hypothetical protein
MTTSQIADRLVELCRQGAFDAAQRELYADDAISIEPDGTPMQVAEGLEAIQEKGRHFMASVQVMHGISISAPLVAGNFFSIAMTLDATFADRGRMAMDEICVYEVEDGKIVCEQFFYSAG